MKTRHARKLRKLIQTATADYWALDTDTLTIDNRSARIKFHPAYFRTISRLAYVHRMH